MVTWTSATYVHLPDDVAFAIHGDGAAVVITVQIGGKYGAEVTVEDEAALGPSALEEILLHAVQGALTLYASLDDATT